MKLNSEKLCRICLKESLYHSKFYDEVGVDGRQISEIVNDLLQLDVEYEDGFPQFLCCVCYKKISEFELFKRTAHEGKAVLLSSRDSFEIVNLIPVQMETVGSLNEAGACPLVNNDVNIKEEDIVPEENESLFEDDMAQLKLEESDLDEEILEREDNPSAINEPMPVEVQGVLPPKVNISLTNNNNSLENIIHNFRLPLVSSVPECSTIGDEVHSEGAWRNQEHSVVDVHTVKGSRDRKLLGMCKLDDNLERHETPIIQKESTGEVTKESAVCVNSYCDNKKENSKECGIRKANVYKGRLRSKMASNENITDQYPESNCRKNGRHCGKKDFCRQPSEIMNLGKTVRDSVLRVVSKKAKKVKNVDKTPCKPGMTSIRTNSYSYKSKGEVKRFLCETCKKGFHFKRDLGCHVRVHNGVRPYKCSICNKCFSQKSSLRTHNSVHSHDRPYICNECGKSFKNGSSLWNHKKMHSIKNVYCDICGKTFVWNSSLYKHMKGHSNYDSFPCVTCGKSFKCKLTFRQHLVNHGVETPFHCKLCGKYFSSKRNLQEHQLTHEDNRPFSCYTCNKSFKNKCP